MSTYSLKKEERLSLNADVDYLFHRGKYVTAYPIRAVYRWMPHRDRFYPPLCILISVAKKKLRLAKDRNRVKRLIREVHRTHKEDFPSYTGESLFIGYIFIGNELPSFEEIKESVSLISSLIRDRSL